MKQVYSDFAHVFNFTHEESIILVCFSVHIFASRLCYIMLFEFWCDANIEKYIPRHKHVNVRTVSFICQLGDCQTAGCNPFLGLCVNLVCRSFPPPHCKFCEARSSSTVAVSAPQSLDAQCLSEGSMKNWPFKGLVYSDSECFCWLRAYPRHTPDIVCVTCLCLFHHGVK